MMWGFDEGWHEAEYTPALGVWRWTSDRAVASHRRRDDRVRVTLRFEPPRALFRGSRATLRQRRCRGGREALSEWRTPLTFDVPFDAIAATDGRIDIETHADLRARGARRRAGSPSSRSARVRICASITSVCVDSTANKRRILRRMVRTTLQITSFALVLSIGAAACGKKAPKSLRRHRRRHPRLRHPRRRPRRRHRHPPRSGARSAHRGPGLRAEDAGSAECRAAARRRVLRSGFVEHPRRCARHPVEERRLHEALDQHPHQRRRALRRARHARNTTWASASAGPTRSRPIWCGLGIGADRVSTVSKGKEAPACTESNESCWQQNRRGHPVFTAK